MAPIDDAVFGGDPISGTEAEVSAAKIARGYYDFEAYVSKTRMLTFWHQLSEVLSTEPESVLEIGVGARVVAGTLRELGVTLTTADVNPALEPDHVGSVLQLDEFVDVDEFDTVLCARVLHHLPFDQFSDAIAQLVRAARHRVVLALPVDEARCYLALRRTAGRYRTVSLKVPQPVKRVLMRWSRSGDARYRHLWKIDSHAVTTRAEIEVILERHSRIVSWYSVPEDQSHAVIVLEPKR